MVYSSFFIPLLMILPLLPPSKFKHLEELSKQHSKDGLYFDQIITTEWRLMKSTLSLSVYTILTLITNNKYLGDSTDIQNTYNMFRFTHGQCSIMYCMMNVKESASLGHCHKSRLEVGKAWEHTEAGSCWRHTS